jgi:N-methylhydantoinase A
MRYLGQEFFVNVEGAFDRDPAAWNESFHATYQRVHGHSRTDYPVELVNLRVAAFGPELDIVQSTTPAAGRSRVGTREVFIDGRAVTAQIHHRDGFVGPLRGPAIIEEVASTTLVPTSWEARLGRAGTIILDHVP